MMCLKILKVETNCTKCKKPIKSGEEVLTNECTVRNSCCIGFVDKVHTWCKECAKFVLEKKLVQQSMKISAMLCEL